MIYLGKDPVGISNPKLSLPDNVHVASFTLENDVTTNDVAIPNPFGSINFKKVFCINFSEDFSNTDVVGFFADLTGNRDGNGNRKILDTNGGLATSAYFPLYEYTDSTLTLRGNGGGIFKAGTYYIFAWNEEVTNNA